MRLVDYPKLEASSFAKISPEAHYYGSGVVKVGRYSRIDHGVILTGDVDVGEFVHIAPYCVLWGGAGIELWNFSGIGAFSVLHSEADDYSGESVCSPLVPPNCRNPKRGKIVFQKMANCGTRTTVLPGVTFEEGAVAGSHSLVKSNLTAWNIYGGTPVYWIKERRRDCAAFCHDIEMGSV